MRRVDRGAERTTGENASEVVGLAAGKVDQVRFADCLEGRRVESLFGCSDEDGLDLRSERGEMRDSEVGPAPEHGLAVGSAGRRDDRDTRA